MLQIWDVHWSLDVDQCPCDVHFVEWLEGAGTKDKTIFHFGTGGHHHVGLANLKMGSPNNFLAITASPKEYDAFIKLAIANPHLSRNYLAYFGDVYLLNPKLLPALDIVTLFHLCEFRGDSQDAYDALTDRQVTDILLDKLAVGGKLLLFSGSFAYPDAKPIAQALVDQGRLRHAETFKSLQIYDRLT
jgi:hypothetical protein